MEIMPANDIDLSKCEKIGPQALPSLSPEDLEKARRGHAKWSNMSWLEKTQFFAPMETPTLR